MSDKAMLYRLEKLLKWKKSKEFYAEKLKITEEQVEELLKELRSKNYVFVEPHKEKETPPNIGIKKVNEEKGTIESVISITYEPRDHQELAKLHNVDLTKFTITNYWTKLQPNGDFTSSLFCRRKNPEEYTEEDFLRVLDNYESNYIPIPSPKMTGKEIVSMALSIADYHLAKKHIDGTNSIEKRAEAFFNIAENLVNKTKAIFDIETIVFPISNDFFHTDNYDGSTTRLTPQDTIVEYDKEYEIGFDVLVKTIKLLKACCINVKVILVQGNHDRTKSFYLAHALEIYFGDDSGIKFEREHSVIKAVKFGNTFIGWHHGNCKIGELPLLFATHPVYGKMFGDAKFREVHTGDKHHYMAIDVKGVRIQQMPSLSGTDRWHSDNNYVHQVRAALALVYDLKHGKIAEFEARI